VPHLTANHPSIYDATRSVIGDHMSVGYQEAMVGALLLARNCIVPACGWKSVV
jgi:hypothetical protein